jgi:hypothetical protein
LQRRKFELKAAKETGWNGPFLLGDGGEAAIWSFPSRAKLSGRRKDRWKIMIDARAKKCSIASWLDNDL